MTDTPLTEAELHQIEKYTSPDPNTVRALVAEIRRLRMDIKQAAKDYTVMRKEDPNYRACEPPWVNRVREREGKNG